jgi:hypothetical protein
MNRRLGKHPAEALLIEHHRPFVWPHARLPFLREYPPLHSRFAS